jgi:hypothetical protein
VSHNVLHHLGDTVTRVRDHMRAQPEHDWAALCERDLADVYRDQEWVTEGFPTEPSREDPAPGRHHDARELGVAGQIVRAAVPAGDFDVVVVPPEQAVVTDVQRLLLAMRGELARPGHLGWRVAIIAADSQSRRLLAPGSGSRPLATRVNDGSRRAFHSAAHALPQGAPSRAGGLPVDASERE